MATVKTKDDRKKAEESKVESLSKFQKHTMIRISGNFQGGGFQISKNKAKAVLDNALLIGRITNGEFDEAVQKLSDNEVLDMGDEQ